MSSFLRYCAYCEEPFEGRADKVYCSSSCKSKDFRRQQAEAAGQQPDEFRPRTQAAAGLQKPYQIVPLSSGQDEDEDEFDEEDDEANEAPASRLSLREQVDQAIQRGVEQHERGVERQALAQLPQQYAACIERVLAADAELLTGRALDRLSELVQQTSAAYQRLAPGRDRPAFLATHLQDLYRVEETLQEASAEWDEERAPVELRLKKKFRAQLRAALAQISRP
jgi:hypothetical protein